MWHDAPGPLRAPERTLAPRWLLVLLSVGIIGYSVWSRGESSPPPSTVLVESGLKESVLVDVRFHFRRGEVEGPVARSLGPDSALGFSLPGGRDACLRIIDREKGLLTSVRLPASPGGHTTLRLDQTVLDLPATVSGHCAPDLGRDRVRVAFGRYFDPALPDRVRRERLLRR